MTVQIVIEYNCIYTKHDLQNMSADYFLVENLIA